MERITKLFMEGNLKGLTYTENGKGYKLNKVYSDCVTNKRYKIIKIEKISSFCSNLYTYNDL